MGEGLLFWAFLVIRVSQHCAFLREGRQGFFNSSLFDQPCLGKIIFFFVLKGLFISWRYAFFYVGMKWISIFNFILAVLWWFSF